MSVLKRIEGMMHEETNKVKQLMEVKSEIGKMHKEANMYDVLINNIERATNPQGEIPSVYDKDKQWPLSFQDPPGGRLPFLPAFPHVVHRQPPYPPPQPQVLQVPPGRYAGGRAVY